MCRVCYGDRESVDGVNPAGERPTETGAKSAVKIGRRELAIRIRGVRAFVAVKYLVDCLLVSYSR